MSLYGHTFPLFFSFRGGKGIATSLGILLLLNWEIGLICLIFALSLMAITRMVSLRLHCSSCVISDFNHFYPKTVFSTRKLSYFWSYYGDIYYVYASNQYKKDFKWDRK